MMTSSGDDNRPSGSLGLLTDKTTRKKIKNKPKAEQETAQPTVARFKKCIGATVIITAIFNEVMDITNTVKTLNLAKKRILPNLAKKMILSKKWLSI